MFLKRKKIAQSLLISGVLALMISCSPTECKNTNPVFDKFTPESKEYKTELFKQLKNKNQSELRFVFEKYEQHNAQDYMLVGIQGIDLCAKGLITVKEWSSLGDIQKNKGKGYTGAELKNLRFEIKNDSSCMELVFKGLDKIQD